jgi:hypothetical protein
MVENLRKPSEDLRLQDCYAEGERGGPADGGSGRCSEFRVAQRREVEKTE